MTDRPPAPARPAPAPAAPSKDLRAKRPGVANADVPSDTVGLPGVGEGASATHFARDTVGHQANEGEEDPDDQVPADPRDAPDVPG